MPAVSVPGGGGGIKSQHQGTRAEAELTYTWWQTSPSQTGNDFVSENSRVQGRGTFSQAVWHRGERKASLEEEALFLPLKRDLCLERALQPVRAWGSVSYFLDLGPCLGTLSFSRLVFLKVLVASELFYVFVGASNTFGSQSKYVPSHHQSSA